MKLPSAVIAAVASSFAAASAQTPPGATARSQCFLSNQYQDFRAINDRSFIIQVNSDVFYRIDLQGSCPEITDRDASLITRVRGSNWICNAQDWDLQVRSAPGAPPEPCIVKSQTRLTPEQAADLPLNQKP
jgi:hypothetical protein